MEYGYITFRSVTHAQRGEKLLSQLKIRCTLQRTPRWMEEQGCGYCLRLHSNELETAARVLRRSGAVYRRLWTGEESGMREVWL